MGNNTFTRDSGNKSHSQHHTGPGDNILGDKIVYHSIPPKAILISVQDAITKIRYRQLDQAKDQLAALRKTSNLDADAVGILNIIQLLIDLADNNPPEDIYQQLGAYLNAVDDPLCRDVAISAQMRLDVKKDKVSDARDRYRAIETSREYTDEVYYEFIADREEIENVFGSQKLQLSEVELCGLVRGCIRLNVPVVALYIAEYLHSFSPTFNSKVLTTAAKINVFNAENEGKYYWQITSSSRKKVLSLCDDVVNLLNECNGNDSRIIDFSASLLDFVFAEYEPLREACWNYISEIKAQRPEIAEQIRLIYERQPGNLEGITQKIYQAQENPSYRKEVIAGITESKHISAEDSFILSNIGDKKSIKKWIDSGGNITSTDKFESDFSLLKLNSFACDNSPKMVEDLRSMADKFINGYKEKLIKLNPPSLLHLAEKLIDSAVPSAACELLKNHVPSEDIWASPIVRCYLNALLASQQMMTLNTILAEIDQNDWDGYIWQIKARQLDYLQKYEEAISAAEEAVTKAPLSIYGWYLLIHLHKRNGTNRDVIVQVLKRIPDDIFSQPSDYGYQLLSEIAAAGDFAKAESFLVKWFINNPDSSSIPFTNFYFSVCIEGDRSTAPNPAPVVGNCLGGVSYASDGKVTTKLLVTDEVASHQSLLFASSPLGQLLSDMVIGEFKQYGMLEIELIERQPPYIAVFNIASSLRQAINDGTDCYHSFQLPEDPAEILKILERKLASPSRDRDLLYSQPNIPLFMKGLRYNKHDPVKSALYHLTEKKSVKQALPAFGDENPSHIILDVYAASYLALTGLVRKLQNSQVNIVFTTETKRYIEQWLSDVNQEEYLSIGVHPEGGLWRHTAEDIRQQTADIQVAFNLILEISEVVSPNMVDLPPEVLRLEDAVDLSVLSSLELSITNDIPWLCIDITFSQLSHVTGYKTVNANQFISQLGRGAPLEQKQKGMYLHVTAGLPYPLTFEDMIQLSKSKDEHSPYFLAELLKMYPAVFSSTGSAVQFLHQILVSVLLNAYSDEEILNGLRVANPRNNGYAERVFNACCHVSMQFNDSKESEHKLAMLLASLLYTFRDLKPIYKLILDMGAVFITGHFMNIEAVNKYIVEQTNN